MSARLDLTPDQREELARLLAAHTGGRESLGALLRGWSALVTEVERGYDDSIDEYTNDLSVRDRLQRIAVGASPGLRAQLDAAVAADDRRFEAATEPATRPLGGSPAPWWGRVPRRRGGELAEDLASLGHLG